MTATNYVANLSLLCAAFWIGLQIGDWLSSLIV